MCFFAKSVSMRQALSFLSLSISVLIISVSSAQARGDVTLRTLDVNGRQVDLYSPALLANKKAPLLLMLHGGGGNSEQLHKTLDADNVAVRGRFHVAYLNGTETFKLKSLSVKGNALGRTWNAGACCNGDEFGQVDDVAFLDQVIDRLVGEGIADPELISILGHSNGAMMAYRYACERGKRLATIIPISGAPVIARCKQMDGVFVLHIHGENDDAVPVAGGKTGSRVVARRMKLPFPSVEASKQIALAGGAQAVDVKIIPGGEHAIETLNEVVTSKTKLGLMDLILSYMNGRDMFPK